MIHSSEPLVLIVDDNEDSRQILAIAVKNAGFAVRHAENGKEALKIIEDVLPALILLDLMMPEMNGFEFVYRLQQGSRTAHIPIIIVSSVARAMAPRVANVVKVIEKARFSIVELSDVIKEIVSGRFDGPNAYTPVVGKDTL